MHQSVVNLKSFAYDIANHLGIALCRLGRDRTLPIGIEVFHRTSQVFPALLPGAKPDNIEWLRRKRNLALRFHQSSLSMRLECAAKGVDLIARFGLSGADHVASGGAVPVAVPGGGLIGCVTVSGLPDTGDDAPVREVLATLQD